MAYQSQRVAVATEAPTGVRYEELKRMLVGRRSEIMGELRGRLRSVRESSDKHESADSVESPDIDIQEDIEFTLIQMKAETLQKINDALDRLEEGSYGYCLECGETIAQPRLHALPFAIRCKDCEEARENKEERRRAAARRNGGDLGFT